MTERPENRAGNSSESLKGEGCLFKKKSGKKMRRTQEHKLWWVAWKSAAGVCVRPRGRARIQSTEEGLERWRGIQKAKRSEGPGKQSKELDPLSTKS